MSRLNRGARMMEILKQGVNQPLLVEQQVVSLYTAVKGHLDDIPVADVRRFESEFLAYMTSSQDAVLQSIRDTKDLTADTPYPEEMNRQLTGVLADLHFAPTSWSAGNLLKENKLPSSVYITGNTVTDVFQYTVQPDYHHPVLEWAAGKRLILMTAHRRESQGEPHRNIFRAVKRIADEFEDIAIVYPVHPSPAVKEPAHEILGNHPRIQLIDPLDVVDLHNFYPHTHLILTDSGGLQEEAPSFGVPVLVLRDTTERPEGIEAGTLEMVGTDEEKIYERAHALLSDSELYASMSEASNPYGDGQASPRIVNAILHHYGILEDRPEEFHTTFKKGPTVVL